MRRVAGSKLVEAWASASDPSWPAWRWYWLSYRQHRAPQQASRGPTCFGATGQGMKTISCGAWGGALGGATLAGALTSSAAPPAGCPLGVPVLELQPAADAGAPLGDEAGAALALKPGRFAVAAQVS